MKEHPRLVNYSDKEELANRLTHLVAAIMSTAGMVVLITVAARTGDPYRIVSASIFCWVFCLFYTISTIYHSVRGPRVRYVFRVLDHAGIFLVIAGSYTPFTLVSMRSGNGWALFGVVWGLAVGGVVFKSFMTHRMAFLAPGLYLCMGWLIVVDLGDLLTLVPVNGVLWLVAGGLFYTIGILFYAISRIPYHHAIWHVFVIAGSFCHYMAVLKYVMPIGMMN
jgi:hemolysin III